MNKSIACDLSVFGSKDNATQHEKNSGSVLKNNECVEERSDGYAFRYSYVDSAEAADEFPLIKIQRAKSMLSDLPVFSSVFPQR